MERLQKKKKIKKTHKLSNLINDVKKKKLSNINLNGDITLYNSIKHRDKMLLLENIPETVVYKYINTKTKQLHSISFQNFQNLYDEEKLTWKTLDMHFVFNMKKVTLSGRDDNYQIIKKKNTEKNFLYLLLLTNTFYVKVSHKVYQNTDWIKYFFENTT